MSRNLFSKLFLKHFSKYLLILSSFTFLFFIIIANEVNLIQRGPSNTNAQEMGFEETIYPEEYGFEETIYPESYAFEDTVYPQDYNFSDTVYPEPGPQYTESAGCDGTHSVWGKWDGNRLVEVEADYGEVPGQCGVGYYSDSGSTSGSSYSTPQYTESAGCDGTHSVWGKWNGNRLIEVEADYGEIPGQCGVSTSMSPTEQAGYQVAYGSGSQQQTGNWQFVYPECDWNSKQVYDVYWHSGTGEYDRRNPHYQEGACGYVTEWEGPGCQGNRSVWGVWDNANRSRLLRVERDYGVVPGECNNPYPTQQPVTYATPVPYSTTRQTYQDRQECSGRQLVVRRYWTDGRTEIVTNYGEYPGYCGVQTRQYAPVQQPVYQAPAPVYQAPRPVSQPVSVQQPVVSIPQIQATCNSSTHQIYRGQTVTYHASISTGGTGRLGRVDFRGEQTQSSNTGSFTVRYDTTGVKYMMATVYDADARGGSQIVQCPNIVVDEPTRPAATLLQQPAVQPISQPPVIQQPIIPQPLPYQQGSAYYPNPAPAAPPTVVYAQQQPVVLTPSVNYCPSGNQQQVVGNTVYCLMYNGAQTQTIAYTYSGSGIINQQVVSQPPINPSATIAPAPTSTAVSNTINCPAGYSAQAYGTTVYCISNQNQLNPTNTSVSQTDGVNVVLAAGANPSSQPQIIGQTQNSITELPKTGLPLMAWGISALLPLGLKMRKAKNKTNTTSANSIWLSREMTR